MGSTHACSGWRNVRQIFAYKMESDFILKNFQNLFYKIYMAQTFFSSMNKEKDLIMKFA